MATEIDEVIRGLYDAACGLETWQAALQRLSELSGSWFAQLVGVHKPTGTVAYSIQSEAAPVDGVMDYVRHYHRIDPHANEAMRNPVGVVYNGERVVPARLVDSNPFYRDFFLPYGARYTIGTKLVDDDELHSYIAVLRRPDAPPYDAADEVLFQSLSFHMTGAVQVMRKVSALQTQAGIGQSLLDRSTRPSFLLSPNRAVRYTNGAGSTLLEDTRLITLRAGFLGFTDPESDSRMIESLDALKLESQVFPSDGQPTRAAFPVRLPGTTRRIPACLWAIRPRGTMGAFGSSAVALLTLAVVESPGSIDPLMLAAMYDLTPAETRVALAIHEGAVVKQIAQHQNVSADTVRYHVKNLLRKCNADTQRELALVLRSIAQM